MSGFVSYRCKSCGRQLQALRSRLIQQLQKRRSCQYCGGELEVPEALLAAAERSTLQVERHVRRARGVCPVCSRFTRGEGKGDPLTVSCRNCGLEYQVSRAGVSYLETDAQLGSAAPDQLQPALDELRAVGETLVADILRQRAKQSEVTLQEVRVVADRVIRLRDAPPTDTDVRVPPEEAVVLLRNLLTRLPSAPSDMKTFVSFVRTRADIARMATSFERAIERYNEVVETWNAAVDPMALALAPLASVVEEESPTAAFMRERFEVIAELAATPSGTRIVWSRTADGHVYSSRGCVQHVTERTRQYLRQQLFDARFEMLAYYRRRALFGARAQGQPLVMASPEAVGQRLTALGLGSAAETLEWFRLRVRPFWLPFAEA